MMSFSRAPQSSPTASLLLHHQEHHAQPAVFSACWPGAGEPLQLCSKVLVQWQRTGRQEPTVQDKCDELVKPSSFQETPAVSSQMSKISSFCHTSQLGNTFVCPRLLLYEVTFSVHLSGANKTARCTQFSELRCTLFLERSPMVRGERLNSSDAISPTQSKVNNTY